METHTSLWNVLKYLQKPEAISIAGGTMIVNGASHTSSLCLVVQVMTAMALFASLMVKVAHISLMKDFNDHISAVQPFRLLIIGQLGF